MAEGLRPIETCPNGHRYNTWKYGDTCKVCGAKIKLPETKKTPEEEKQAKEAQIQNRVVGWLVCMKGSNEGMDYRLKAGKNFIGSDPNMDVYIRGDRKVDRKKHAVVMYDDMTRKAMLLPGESQGMVYHRNEAVYAPVELKAMDEIEIGKSLFFFIPFCSTKFTWEDFSAYKKANEGNDAE